MKLKRDAEGRYHGTYAGQELIVWRGERSWSAECPTIAVARNSCPTRAYAVREIRDAIDEAAVVIPELDRLLERWTAAVKAVVARLGDQPQGVRAHVALADLRHALSWLDGSVRMQAVRFERDLAKLEAHSAEAGPELLEGEPAPAEIS
jgi:hypothetical protein